jgi:7-cyano-7-deazaguanine reductase
VASGRRLVRKAREDGGVSDLSKLTLLGAERTTYRYDNPDAATLEVFDNLHPKSLSVVELDCREFTSLCPMTGQPDFGRIRIHFVPGPRCVESKSLKLYLGAYRNHGSFHEDCVNRIADDIFGRIEPRYLRVFGEFNARGGIAIKPLAVRVGPDVDDDERAQILVTLAQHDALTGR